MSHKYQKCPPVLLRYGDGVLRRRKYYLRTFGKAPKAHVIALGTVLRLVNFNIKQIKYLMNHYKIGCNYYADGRIRYVKSVNHPVAPGDQLWVDGQWVLASIDEKGGLKLQPSDGVLRLKVLGRRRQKGGVNSLVCNKGYIFRTDELGDWIELSSAGLKVVSPTESECFLSSHKGCINRAKLKAPVSLGDIDARENVYVL